MTDDPAAEVVDALQEEIARRNASGKVVLRGTTAELHGPDGVIAVEIGALVEQWLLLPTEARGRRVMEIGARLAGTSAGAARPQRSATRKGPQKPLLIAVPGRIVILLTIALVLYVYVQHGEELTGLFASQPPAEASAGTESGDERQQRVARVCEAARERILSGASVAALDLEGWVFELWVDGGSDPKGELAALAAAGKLGEEASAFPLGDATVTDGVTAADARGHRLVLGGDFVGHYLDPAARAQIDEALAAWLAANGIERAVALTRCAHQDDHDLAGLVWGSTPNDAAIAAVYAVSRFSLLLPLSGDLAALRDGEAVNAHFAERPDAAALRSAAEEAGARILRDDDGGFAIRFTLSTARGAPRFGDLAARAANQAEPSSP